MKIINPLWTHCIRGALPQRVYAVSPAAMARNARKRAKPFMNIQSEANEDARLRLFEKPTLAASRCRVDLRPERPAGGKSCNRSYQIVTTLIGGRRAGRRQF